MESSDVASPVASSGKTENAAAENGYVERDYQISLAEKAVTENLLISLRTGSGKTLIAVLLIKRLAEQIRIPLQQGGKRSVFVVNTVVLVRQQAAYIRKHSDLKVAELCGNSKADFYSAADWDSLMNDYEVLVVVAQLFADGLNHAFVSMQQFNVVVFDECHHATGNHPYVIAMNHYVRCPIESRPRILGLTASVLNKGNSSLNVLAEFSRLERTLCSRIEASTWFLAASRFGTEPEVRIVTCKNDMADDYVHITNQLSDKCQQIVDFIANVKFSVARGQTTLQLISKMFSSVQNVVTHLGLWPALKACDEQLHELTVLGRACFTEGMLSFIALGLTQMRCLKYLLETYIKSVKSYDKLKSYISPRLRGLIDLLIQANKRYFTMAEWNDGNDQFCGIVFVQRRYTAYLIDALLKEIQMWEPVVLSHLKVCFVVGNGNGTASVFNRSEYRQQDTNISCFRSGDKNFVVATSVLEEGFDVQRCNMVIRFDPPLSFRSYIQSKGRARKRGSEYLILCDELEKAKVKKLLLSFLETESQLANYDGSTDVGDVQFDRDTEMDSLVTPYDVWLTLEDGSSRLARVTLSTSTRLLHMFCDKLPSATPGKAKLRYKYMALFDSVCTAKFVCTVDIPSIRLSESGVAMPTRELAKRAAALETCKTLHRSGRLNQHLLPFGVHDVVLLDFGAYRSFPSRFVDQYFSVINSAAEGDRKSILKYSRDVGFLTVYESKVMEEAHTNAVMILGEAFGSDRVFDFSTQDTTKRINRLIPVMLEHRLRPPTDEVYSFHRKMAGAFLLCAKMKAMVNCFELFANIKATSELAAAKEA
uniref:Helicase ATP-binding domain-containing protein n=1 Tax=Trichuris muris TaxID=70415 RepID=A0A5S6QL02_TRIMR